MATPTVYVICDSNCKWEGMTKEQILTAITQAVNDGSIGNIDTGFVQTIKTINGKPLRFFYGTQAQYNTLAAEAKQDLFAIITDDATKENMEQLFESLQSSIDDIVARMNATDISNNTKFDVLNSRLNKIGVMPTLNTSKCLDKMGYYYIECALVGTPSIRNTVGVVFYSPMMEHKIHIEMPSDGGALQIDDEGNMKVIKNNDDVTSIYYFYTSLIIGY